jgi:predicted DNA-binding transcriptional regulator AlpA
MPYYSGMNTPSTTIDPERPLATAKPWVACGISRAQWFKLAASGRTPLPIRLGTRRPVFLLSELEAWLKAGAPDRQTWERMKGGRP